MSSGPPILKILQPLVRRYMMEEDDSVEFNSKIKALIATQSQNLSSQAVFSELMSKMVISALDLINYADAKELVKFKLAGLSIFDRLYDVNDELVPERRMEICNYLMKTFENEKVPFPVYEVVLKTAALSIGHFCRVASVAELEFLQAFYFPFAIKLMKNSRSESHRYAGSMIMYQLAINAPALTFLKRSHLFAVIWDMVCDKSELVRTASGHALNAVLVLTSQRESMAEYTATALNYIAVGLPVTANSERTIGSLIILNIMLQGIVVSMPDLASSIRSKGMQLQEIIWDVIQRKDAKDPEVRAKVIELLPSLASSFPNTFTQPNNRLAHPNFLGYAVKYLMDTVVARKEREHAYLALGKLFVAMPDHFESTNQIYAIHSVICGGLNDPFCPQALHCLGHIVSVSRAMQKLVDNKLVDLMFRGGITADLIDNLTIVVSSVPSVRSQTQVQLRTHITSILNKYKPLIDEASSKGPTARYARGTGSLSSAFGGGSSISSSVLKESTPRPVSKADSNGSTSSGGWKSFFGLKSAEKEKDKASGISGPGNSPQSTNGGRVALGGSSVGQDTMKPIQELVFALQLLARKEFFPKLTRKGNSGSSSLPGSAGGSRDRSRAPSLSQQSTSGGSTPKSNVSVPLNNYNLRTGISKLVRSNNPEAGSGSHSRSPSFSIDNYNGIGAADDGSISMSTEQYIPLLVITYHSVLKYFDDYHPDVRAAAVQASIAVLQAVVSYIEPNTREFAFVAQILDRVLTLGVGDDSSRIRMQIFQSLSPSLDHLIALSNNVNCLEQALSDETLSVRSVAMSVFARVSHYDSLHFMSTLRLSLKRLIVMLKTTRDPRAMEECVVMLQSIVCSTDDALILPYINEVMETLVSLLGNHSSSQVVVAALFTIGELALASPAGVLVHIETLSPRLMEAVRDETAPTKQETAVITIGKLVAVVAVVTDEPYGYFNGLFPALLKLITREDSAAHHRLRLEAIKTMGKIGPVDVSVFQGMEALASTSINVFTESGDVGDAFEDAYEDNDEDDGASVLNGAGTPAHKRLSATERNNFSIVVKSLTNVMKDASLTQHHSLTAGVALKTVRTIGSQISRQQADELVEGLFSLVYLPESTYNLKEALLDHAIALIFMLGKAMRPYLERTVKLACDFFESHLKLSLDILEALCYVSSAPDINNVLHTLMPLVYRSVQEDILLYEDGSSSSSGVGGSSSSASVGSSGGGNGVIMGGGANGNQGGLGGVENTRSSQSGNANSVIAQNALLAAAAAATASATKRRSKSQVATRTSIILQKLVVIGGFLGDYKRDVLLCCLSILDNEENSPMTRKETLSVLVNLAADEDLRELASRIVHSLRRLFAIGCVNDFTLQCAGITCLSYLVCRLRTNYLPFIVPVRRALKAASASGASFARLSKAADEYEALVNRLLKSKALPMDPMDISDLAVKPEESIHSRRRASSAAAGGGDEGFEPSYTALNTAWALAGRNNASDLTEWMSRFTLELIRQSPSSVIRECSALVKVYRPLADELFNCAFNNIWIYLFAGDKNDVVHDNALINGLETALQSPHIPTNIMTSLLNMIEFMDMQDKPLPISEKLLGRCAKAANMSAKSLRYRELEFMSKNVEPSLECIDALISVNNQLGLISRCVGILTLVKENLSDILAVQPQWLEKLERWEDARNSYALQSEAYTEKMGRDVADESCELNAEGKVMHEEWLSAELGKMRCLHALGEFEELEKSASAMRRFLSTAQSNRAVELMGGEGAAQLAVCEAQIARLGANAAWMLGNWDTMDEFLEDYGEDGQLLQQPTQQLQQQTFSMDFSTTSSFSSGPSFSISTGGGGAGVTSQIGGMAAPSWTTYSAAVSRLGGVGVNDDVLLEQNMSFFEAVQCIHHKDYVRARYLIALTRESLNTSISSLMHESYSRASKAMVTMQMLSEMEEVVEYRVACDIADGLDSQKGSGSSAVGAATVGPVGPASSAAAAAAAAALTSGNAADMKSALLRRWTGRLKNVPKQVDVYRQILAVHSLVASPSEDVDSWLELVTLSRKEGMLSFCNFILKKLGAPLCDGWLPEPTEAVVSPRVEPMQQQRSVSPLPLRSESYDRSMRSIAAVEPACIPTAIVTSSATEATRAAVFAKTDSRILYAMFKYWWTIGERAKALEGLSTFLDWQNLHCAYNANKSVNSFTASASAVAKAAVETKKENVRFRVRCLLKQADWMREINASSGTVDVSAILRTLQQARDIDDDNYKVWHAWAVTNYDQLRKVDEQSSAENTPSSLVRKSIGPSSSIHASPHASNFNSSKPTHLAINTRVGALLSPSLARGTPIAGDNPSGSTPGNNSTNNSGIYNKFGAGVNFQSPGPSTVRRGSNALSISSLQSIQQMDSLSAYVVEAIKGFVRSIVLGQGQPVAHVLQDTLRLLTLWFSYGTKKGVDHILDTELDKISPDYWLSVIPQLIARIHIKSPEISTLLKKLLCKVAKVHPQALVCPISVALNTDDEQQKEVAVAVLREVRKNRSQLVEEATMLSRELMRAAVTPHELWHDGLEQAAQLYLDNKDTKGMLDVLTELHEALNDTVATSNKHGNNGGVEGFSESIGKIGSVTLRDIGFRQSFGITLTEAHYWLEQYRISDKISDLQQAWDVYHPLFKRIKQQIGKLKTLELYHVSPALTTARDLTLAVPGTYDPSTKDIQIQRFLPHIGVIASKQRPRRMSIVGSDGKLYQFLLKGHEDLRQDERVMQLFGLINVCLDTGHSPTTHKIVRYSVLPLSNNSGVIGWVKNCDTLHQLVKQYREAGDVSLMKEVKLLASKSLNYDKLPLIHKVECFRQVQEETTGQDLAKMLWLKSTTSEVWVTRRAHFVNSLAAMSMVGYILGLGDRHPSNLMIDRVSGRVVHIDFGDCFEITKTRAKYPEIIPFRLTRMLTECMGVGGLNGTFQLNCEKVMRVLRDNRDSVMAMLEAFVYDPLISWRLLNKGDEPGAATTLPDDPTAASKEGLSATSKKNKGINGERGGGDGDGGEGDGASTPTGSEMQSVQSSMPAHSMAAARDKLAGTLMDVLQAGDAHTGRDGPTGTIPHAVRRTNSASLETAEEEAPLQEAHLNARALEVINRIQAKLQGTDFMQSHSLDIDNLNNLDSDTAAVPLLDEADYVVMTVEQQVERLIQEATSVENLCQLFSGWCALW